MRRVTALGVSGVLLAMSAFAQGPPAPTKDPAREAVVLLRMVNTAQAALNGESGSFGALTRVLNTELFTQRYGALTATDPTAVVVNGQKLSLILIDGGKRYVASVTPAEPCGQAAFTDEGGLIYTGRVLGC